MHHCAETSNQRFFVMLVGYMRVSSESDRQITDLQRDALLAAGVDGRHLFEDHASGAKDDRLGLNQALTFVRPGDVLVVWKLDRLGRSLSHLLRCFTKKNVQHPTYKAFAELGKAIKTIFLCRYLHSEELRREINDGLNVVEQWNGATDFVFFARRGEMVSNRREDHEISMLALHLIQNCMVYINTLMIQKVLAQPHWQGKLTPRDYAALTPLIWEHVNPYGRFDLDMNARLALL